MNIKQEIYQNKEVFLVYTITLAIILFISYYNTFSSTNLMLSDLLFSQKQGSDSLIIVVIDEKTINAYGWPLNRTLYAEIIKSFNNSKVIAFDIAFFTEQENDKDLSLAINNSKAVIVLASFYDSSTKSIYYPVIRANYKTGVVNVYADQDGIVRKIPLKIGNESAFSYEIAKAYIGYKPKMPGIDNVIIINYIGKPGTFKTVSFYDILNEKEKLKDTIEKAKIVLVGASAETLHDNYFVPTSQGKKMSGIEIHANALTTILTGSFLKEQDNLTTTILCIAIFILLLIVSKKFNIVSTLLLAIFLWISYIFIVAFAFDYGIIMNITSPTTAIILSLLGCYAANTIKERKEKEFVKRLFGKYISKQIADFIIEKHRKGKINELREATIMFVDIRGFTTLAEKLGPVKTFEILNTYLGEITEIIEKNEGIVNKYIGDAVLAVFNCPFDVKEHETKACHAALEIISKIKELNNKTGNNINVGIGIHTGKVIAGDIGSEQRIEYTIIGDNVNLCSRLEGLTKVYKVEIIISKDTKKKIDENNFYTRILDTVIVKGKTKPVEVYELRKNFPESLLKSWNKAYYLYKNWKIKEAYKMFNAIFKNYKDKTAKVFIERCKEHLIKKTKIRKGLNYYKAESK